MGSKWLKTHNKWVSMPLFVLSSSLYLEIKVDVRSTSPQLYFSIYLPIYTRGEAAVP